MLHKFHEDYNWWRIMQLPELFKVHHTDALPQKCIFSFVDVKKCIWSQPLSPNPQSENVLPKVKPNPRS